MCKINADGEGVPAIRRGPPVRGKQASPPVVQQDAGQSAFRIGVFRLRGEATGEGGADAVR